MDESLVVPDFSWAPCVAVREVDKYIKDYVASLVMKVAEQDMAKLETTGQKKHTPTFF